MSNEVRGLLFSREKTGVAVLRYSGYVGIIRKKCAFADHIFTTVQKSVESLKPEVRHPDMVGIRIDKTE